LRAQVHASRVEPNEERLARCLLPLHEVDGRAEVSSSIVSIRFLVSAPVSFDGLPADLAEARIERGVIPVGSLAPQDAARPELGAVGRSLE